MKPITFKLILNAMWCITTIIGIALIVIFG